MTSDRSIIAVDADNVLVDTTSPLLRFYRRNYNPASPALTVANCHTYNLWELWQCDRNTAIKVVMDYFSSPEASTALPIHGASSALSELRKRHRLIVVTARRSEFEQMTKEWLGCHFPGIFHDVLFGNHFSTEGLEIPKAELCRQTDAVVLIDDQPDHLTPCEEAGITGILFGTYPWQRPAQIPASILRAPNWPAVLAHLTQ